MNKPPFFETGYRAELGTHLFTAEEIIRFATKYDPQPFHVDVEKARQSVLGGLCASGWHTASVWMRKQRDHAAVALRQWLAQGNAPYEYGPSPGFEKLRWIRPVYAGDAITYFNQTLSCRPSASRPGWHVLIGGPEAINQHGEPVLSFESAVFVRYPVT